MAGTISLLPSDNTDALYDNIRLANDEDKTLQLLPGIHLTKPGRGRAHKIKLNANGLRINAGLFSLLTTIKRPDHSIPVGVPGDPDFGKNADDNYGLFFIPSDATDEEFAAVPVNDWKDHIDGDGRFQYAVIIRGSIEIKDLQVDCNMGNQGLAAVYENPPPENRRPAEHSAMLAFSGTSTKKTTGPFAGKRIYIAFEKVVINNVTIHNGGFADDIWISRGYFNPNIENVIINRVTAVNRVDRHRGTISFSGLAQNVDIRNSNVYRLECEETSSEWNELPRKANTYKDSAWYLDQITATHIDIAAKGKSIHLTGKRLTTRESFQIYQVGGKISNSEFVKGTESRMIRLEHMIFEKVKWKLAALSSGEMHGLRPAAQYDETCEVQFISNTFTAVGSFSRGGLITSEYSPVSPSNSVIVRFHGCKFDPRFASAEFPDTFLIKADERGTWFIKRSDLRDIDPARALRTNAARTDVTIVLYEVA